MAFAVRGLIVLQVMLLVWGHAIWLYVWIHLGRMPKYGAPESWSSPPLVDHPSLMIPAQLLILLQFTPLGMLATTAAIYIAVRRGRSSVDLIWGVCALVSFVALWVDPFSALSWYLD